MARDPGFQRNTYYHGNRLSPSLLRARKPYLIKNAVGGLIIVAIDVGIYYYTIKTIGQDKFEDVKVPDQPSPPSDAQKST